MRLTEYLIEMKTKTNNLAKVKNLNCWGMDLTDISIVERMPNIEVLSLSGNAIESLQPLQRCLKLQTLYIRKNNIRKIKELAFLQRLPALSNLALSENPLCESLGAQYRDAVLRWLPNLKMLDEKTVMPSEREEASFKTPINDVEEPACNDGESSCENLCIQKQHFQDEDQISNASPSPKKESIAKRNCQRSESFDCQATIAQRDSDSFSIVSESPSTGSGDYLASPRQQPVSSSFGTTHHLGQPENLNASNPHVFRGLGMQLGAEDRNSGHESKCQAALLTAAKCIVEILDNNRLKILDQALHSVLKDEDSSE